MRRQSVRFYIHQVAVAIDQLVNALTGGWADETISARSWRLGQKDKRWRAISKAIDIIFFFEKEHCFNCYLSERDRSHLSPEYRK